MYSIENYRLAREEIEARRANAEATAEARNDELRFLYSEIKEIDDELTGTGLALFKLACSGGDIAPLRARNEELMAKRRKILVGLGYPADYTDVHYVCKDCSDTGFVGTKMCKCLKELLITKNIRSSGIGSLIEKQSFENFDLEWYRDDEQGYQRMIKNLDTAKAFAKNFAAHRDNLLLIGSTGTGKTHISTAIAREVIHQGYDVHYDSIQNVITAFENDRFHSGYGQREIEGDKYLECDLLIIDDLGTEFVNQFSIATLYNIINTRCNKGLSTIISTNLSAADLRAKYDGRIISRIIGSDYKVLFFTGKDHRVGM
ncbi:MAG: ATP-binding protein [Clostridia bacterium]|nr:ATP-binding protein [Clostridia bacterium]